MPSFKWLSEHELQGQSFFWTNMGWVSGSNEFWDLAKKFHIFKFINQCPRETQRYKL